MDKPVEHYWHIKLNQLKENLEKNNFEVFVAESLQDVRSIVMDTLLPRIKPTSISWGGSMTFVASGLYDELKNSQSMTVLDTFDKDIPAEESMERLGMDKGQKCYDHRCDYQDGPLKIRERQCSDQCQQHDRDEVNEAFGEKSGEAVDVGHTMTFEI